MCQRTSDLPERELMAVCQVKCLFGQIQRLPGLTQATVDAVLWEVYQATRLRPAAGVMLDVSGANAAPSGVHRAAQACPVTVSTPGKEIAHELRCDGCGAGLKKWGSVTFEV